MRQMTNAMDGVRFAVGNKGLMFVRIAVLSAVALSRGPDSTFFSDAERHHALSFWSQHGRFRVDAAKDAFTKGPWVVRLSPEGSAWLYKLDSARGLLKGSQPDPNLPSADVQRTWTTTSRQERCRSPSTARPTPTTQPHCRCPSQVCGSTSAPRRSSHSGLT